ncbi:MarR family winged helix-turn-helix transcriptional regulator [Tateyamaria omphalii]|uniref:MarR family winged helix-turn-helix transcriptional regulator n=1 Tax=Tateyamaria omphalii TaxID=299262 RepID=UPI001679D59A|nr:MarR family transcriptional regulator [Tateyamaria omphalii]
MQRLGAGKWPTFAGFPHAPLQKLCDLSRKYSADLILLKGDHMTNQIRTRPDKVKARQLEQNRNLFGRLSAAALASRVQAQRMLKSAGELSITEWRVLWDLAEAGPLTVTEMAAIQHTDHALISRAIPMMVRKGYATTSVSQTDRRQSLIELTDQGRDVFNQTSVVMSARRAALSRTFSEDDVDTFIKLIDRFEAFVEAPLPENPTAEAAP